MNNNGRMTETGKIICDIRGFGLIREAATREGWPSQCNENLCRKVHREWNEYGFQVSNLPVHLHERFLLIDSEAPQRAPPAGLGSRLIGPGG